MKAAKNTAPAPALDYLRTLIAEHVAAQVADSWKGGGDPFDVPAIEAEAAACAARLDAALRKLERDGLDGA